jgi:hypothetical protein
MRANRSVQLSEGEELLSLNFVISALVLLASDKIRNIGYGLQLLTAGLQQSGMVRDQQRRQSIASGRLQLPQFTEPGFRLRQEYFPLIGDIEVRLVWFDIGNQIGRLRLSMPEKKLNV